LCVPPGQAIAGGRSDADLANANAMSCSALWEGRHIPLTLPLLLDDHELCAANVSILLKAFKENTTTIFRFCLLEKRVLFLGRSCSAWLTCKMVSLKINTLFVQPASPLFPLNCGQGDYCCVFGRSCSSSRAAFRIPIRIISRYIVFDNRWLHRRYTTEMNSNFISVDVYYCYYY
jgi:hypothetical protein